MVIGYSGSGKSTLAAWIAEKEGCALLHLDALHFLPGWVERAEEEELRLMDEFLDSHDSWVIDGNYSRLRYERRLQEADRILFLNFFRFTCLYRAFQRYRQNKGQSRSSMAEGCPEKFDIEFMRWILFDGRSRKQRERYARVCRDYAGKVTVLRDQREIDAWERSFR